MVTSKITLITGCMFSGKTLRLIKEYNERKSRCEDVIFLKPDYDTRNKNNIVTAYTGDSVECESFESFDLTRCKELSTIFIDEIHFLQYEDLTT